MLLVYLVFDENEGRPKGSRRWSCDIVTASGDAMTDKEVLSNGQSLGPDTKPMDRDVRHVSWSSSFPILPYWLATLEDSTALRSCLECVSEIDWTH